VLDIRAPVSPALVAGLLLAAGEHLRILELPCPTVAQVIAATGASRSRAYELRDAVLAAVPSLLRPVGRPPVRPREATPDVTCALARVVNTFLMDHPGCVGGSEQRRAYADAFRHFVLGLRDKHADMGIEVFAEAVMVPLGTLKDWLGAGAQTPTDQSTSDDEADDADATGTTQASAQVQVVLSCWETWRGTFGDFCNYLRDEQRISFGRSLISTRPTRQEARASGILGWKVVDNRTELSLGGAELSLGGALVSHRQAAVAGGGAVRFQGRQNIVPARHPRPGRRCRAASRRRAGSSAGRTPPGVSGNQTRPSVGGLRLWAGLRHVRRN
jgi:hypothetical protein